LSSGNYFYINELNISLLKHKTPEIFNTDQESQYSDNAFTVGLKDHGVQISMNCKGRCMDNSFISRLWGSKSRKDIPGEICNQSVITLSVLTIL